MLSPVSEKATAAAPLVVDAARAAVLNCLDARPGAELGGTCAPDEVALKGHLTVPVSIIETVLGIVPESGQFHYVIEADSAFTGFL